MSDSDAARADSEATFEAACHTVSALLNATRDQPRRIRVQSGDAFVEVEWPEKPETHPAAGVSLPDGQLDGAAGSVAGVRHISAPMVGTFYRAPSPGAEPFVNEGDLVEAGQQVGILEAMKLLNPIEADHAGRVVEILAPDASAVEYEQPLIALDPGTGS